MFEPSEELDGLARIVVDAALEVHRGLGSAFAEGIYENALAHELWLRSVAFERQVVVPVHYKGIVVGEGRADLLVGGLLVVELKALPALLPAHVSQVLCYLRALHLQLGLLLNFGERQIRHGCRRVILTE